MILRFEFDPMLGQRLNYIWYSHRRPWDITVGDLLEVGAEDGYIRAKFKITERQARESERWDAENNRVMIELVDADGRTVAENWVEMKEPAMIGTLCLGDPYDA